MAAAIIGGRRLLIVLLLCVAFNQCWRYLCCLSRATVGVDRICSFWGSAGLLEKESWIKWYLLQRPGYQTTNKSDRTAADEVCLANRWWNVLFVIDTSEWCNYSLNDVLVDKASFVTRYTSLSIESWTHCLSHVRWVTSKSLDSLKGVFQKKLSLFV